MGLESTMAGPVSSQPPSPRPHQCNSSIHPTSCSKRSRMGSRHRSPATEEAAESVAERAWGDVCVPSTRHPTSSASRNKDRPI